MFRKRFFQTASKQPRLAIEDVSDTVGDQRKQKGKKVDYLYSRSTNEFLNCLKNLTPEQRAAVQELGFGQVLHFHMKEIPGYLAYWVLSALDLNRCQINLSRGGSLALDEEDVHLTLGFPRGPTPISRPVDKQKDFKFNDSLAARCGKGRYKMTAADIGKLIAAEVNGGPEFKRMFMCMLENALVETPADGNLKPKVLHFINDVDNIKNYNWCGYVLSVLEATYPPWARGESLYFTGPIHFLLGTYVDRVVHIRRRVSRAWPTIKGWTTDDLKKREELEHYQFGTGRLEGRFDKEQYVRDEEARRLDDV